MSIGNTGNGSVSIAEALASLLVGNNASGQSTNLTTGTYNFYNIEVGCNVGDSNNGISVTRSGTVLKAVNNLIVGQNGSANSLTISNGGTVLNTGPGVIGLNSTAIGNSALVTGAGSTWSNVSSLLIGDSGSGNSLAVESGAQVLAGGVGSTLGYNTGSSNNSLLIDGSGSILSSSMDFVVGYAGNSNSVVISNGGTMSNGQLSFGGVIGLYAGASNNSVEVTGAGSAWNNGGDLLVGWEDSGNRLSISNGGSVQSSQVNYGGAIGFIAGSSNNGVLVTGTGSSWSNSGDLLLGVSGSGNSMVISNGGTVSNSQVNYGGVIGFNSGSSNNSVLVTGAGSTWSNSGDLLVGVSGSGNSLVISNGGTVANGQVTYGGVIGLNVGSLNNSVLVTGAGSTWNVHGNLWVGDAGSGTLTVANGGSTVAGAVIIASSAGSSGTLNIGSLGASNTAGTIITPTITFGAGSGSINFNQVDTATMTNIISGNGSLNQLGSGTTILTRSNSYSGTTTVSAGTLLANNTSGSAVGTSIVTVNGGTLGGTGIIATATTIASGGTLAGGAGGSGNLTFTGGLSLETGSTTSFTIHSANDFTSIYLVGNTLNYGGALDFNIASYNPVVGNLFNVFNMIAWATESGEFSSVKVGNIYLTDSSGIWSGISAGATYQFNDATGSLTVTEATPSLLVGENASNQSTNFTAGSNSFYNISIGINAGNSNNSVTVTNSGTFLQASGDLVVGMGGSGNGMLVSGGALVTNGQINYGGVIGLNASSSNNSVVVKGAGSTWSNGGNLTVGYNGSGNSLVITNGGTVINQGKSSTGGVLGMNTNSSNNSVTVTGAGSQWISTSDLEIGYNGSGNSLVISNGGSVSNTQVNFGGVIGWGASSSNNSVLVTGAGSTWSNSGNLTIGYSGNGTLTIANGGSVAASAITIASQAGSSGTLNFGSLGGSDSAGSLIGPGISFGSGSGTINFNQVDTLTGSGFSGNGCINQLGSGTTMLNGTNTYSGTTTVSAGTLVANGQASLGSSSIIVNGGTLLASGTFTAPPLTINTGALVFTGNGSLWDNKGNSLYIGNSTSGANLSLSNGATILNTDLVLGNSSTASNNSVVVTGTGSVLSNSGNLTLGSAGSGNTLSVANGGRVFDTYGYIGSDSTSSNNSAIVSGSGSIWSNSSFVSVGANASSWGHLTISDGGVVKSSGGYVGYQGDHSSALVTGSGSIWSNNGTIEISQGGNPTDNTLTVANEGSVITGTLSIAQYYGGASGSLNIGRLGTNGTAGTFSAATIYIGTGGTINFNQSDTSTMTSSIIGWNAGGFINQLGSGTTILTGNNSAYNGATTVSAGTLLANSSNALGSSLVTVSNTGTLGGNGTIRGTTTIASGGTLTAGSGGVGSLGFTGGLRLAAGSTTSFQIHSTNDFTSINLIGSSVNYGGTLVFNLINYTPVTGNEFTLFNMSGGATESGNFASIEVGTSYLNYAAGLWSGTNDGVSYQFNDATGQLSVQAVPEPSTWALLGLGALGMMIVLRRRGLV